MIKVTPYIDTIGDEDFKKFLSQEFRVDMLSPVFGDESLSTLFADWRGKFMMNWFKFVNGEDVTLEFYPDQYKVKKPGNEMITLSIPKSLNTFVNTMSMFEIPIYWSPAMDEAFEPKQYMASTEIEDYYRELLAKMGKSIELL